MAKRNFAFEMRRKRRNGKKEEKKIKNCEVKDKLLQKNQQENNVSCNAISKKYTWLLSPDYYLNFSLYNLPECTYSIQHTVHKMLSAEHVYAKKV